METWDALKWWTTGLLLNRKAEFFYNYYFCFGCLSSLHCLRTLSSLLYRKYICLNPNVVGVDCLSLKDLDLEAFIIYA